VPVQWHVPVALAFIITVFIAAPLMGAVIELILIRRIANQSIRNILGVTTGLTVLLLGLVNEIWKPTNREVPLFFGDNGFTIFHVHVVWQDVITIGAAIAIAIGLNILLYRTRTGIAMRGVVDNRELVGLFGGRPSSYSTLSWAIGASLASVAGILVAPTLQLQSLILTLLVIDAYGAAIIGRLRSLPMTFLGAMIIGLATSYATGYIPSTGFWNSTPLQGLKLSVPEVILFLVLLALPMSKPNPVGLKRRSGLAPASFMRSVQGGVVLVAAVVVAVSFLDPGRIVTLGVALGTALLLLSLVPLAGWGGQVSLCQLTFAGIGAFAMYKFGSGGSFVGILAAAGIAGAAGTFVALFAVRLRGLYLALATLAFAGAMDNMFFPSPSIFGFNGSVLIPKPSIFGLHANSNKSFVIVLAVVFAVFAIALLALRRGPFGRVLIAMKDSEAACATLGLSLTTTKLVVFTLSAALAGVAGALYGAAGSVAGATQFESFSSLVVLVALVVFGASTTSGALAGGLLIVYLPSAAEFIIIGLAGMFLGYIPDGILTGVYSWLNRVVEPFRTSSSLGSPPRADRLPQLLGSEA
jgi:branched-chain amino acid transport system permease protein